MKQFFSNHPLTTTTGQSIVEALWNLYQLAYEDGVTRSFESFKRHYYLWRASQSTMIPGANAA